MCIAPLRHSLAAADTKWQAAGLPRVAGHFPKPAHLHASTLVGVLQAPVEDGLVHVDIALPDYKLAFFLDAPLPATSTSRSGGRLTNLDAEGAMLTGWVACGAGWQVVVVQAGALLSTSQAA